MRFSSKRWFTLREVLVIVVVVAIWLMSIITLLTYGLSYVQKSRQKIIAINLAREGIESIYQIRDTNRQRWAGQRDACWLKTNPLQDGWDDDCSNDTRMQSGSYVLNTAELSGQRYLLLTGYSTTWFNISDGIDANDLTYNLCFSGGLRIACPGVNSTTSEGMYLREIQGYGLFAKDVSVTWWQYLLCTDGESTCWSTSAKEFRFCSKVAYVWYGTGEVELCGILTNFAPLK